jgi:hypothetical protein
MLRNRSRIEISLYHHCKSQSENSETIKRIEQILEKTSQNLNLSQSMQDINPSSTHRKYNYPSDFNLTNHSIDLNVKNTSSSFNRQSVENNTNKQSRISPRREISQTEQNGNNYTFDKLHLSTQKQS